MKLHISDRGALQPAFGRTAWRHPIRWWKWRRYRQRVAPVARAMSAVAASSARTKLTTYGLACLAVDAACYRGKRFREITGIGWDVLAREHPLEWWHDYDEAAVRRPSDAQDGGS